MKKGNEKPAVFFSHASRDKELILPIRNRIVERTIGAIDLFMSSDGSSIPFGHNWVKEIEEALKRCRLMFVWLTPSSRASSWIPFEAGYANSRGIKVVPLGYAGLRLDSVPPPLGLLQGFDIRDARSLENITQLINSECHLDAQSVFDDDFFQSLLREEHSNEEVSLLECVTTAEAVVEVERRTDDLGDSWDAVIARNLMARGLESAKSGGRVFGPGFDISVSSGANGGPFSMSIECDPAALPLAAPAIVSTIRQLGTTPKSRLAFNVNLSPGYSLPSQSVLLGHRLRDSEVSYDSSSPHSLYKFRNIEFTVEAWFGTRGAAYGILSIVVPLDLEGGVEVVPLLKLLSQRQILRRTNQ